MKPEGIEEIELLYLLEKEAQELARNNFAAFVQYTMPDYEMNWHHKFLCDKLELFVAKKIRRLMVFMPPRRGKLIADTTPVLTLHGWKTHGELRIGDYVFGIDGQPKKVLAISPKDSADIEIAFSNGESILCHEAHEWVVFDRTVGKDRIVEAREFLKTTKFNRPKQLKSKGRHLYQLPRISALDTPPIFLPLDPYFLGLWLGDGSTGKVCITHHKDDTQPITYLKGGGFEVSSICTHNDTGVLTTYFVPTKIKKALISLGIFKQKDLPEIYLRASKSQRLSLLAGLIDSDGHVDKAGRVIFSNTNERIILSVRELLLTLGIRPYLSRREPKTSSSGVVGRKVVYELGFQPIEPIPLKLPRKRDRISRFVSGLPVRIEGVRRVAPEIGRCIEVEGGIYLVGKTLLPTHNSQLVSRHLPAYILGKNPNTEIIASSYNIGLATRMNRDVQRIIDSPEYKKVFPETKLFGKNIKTLSGTPLRNSEIFEICDAKGVYRASGVGTGITGMGFHYGIIDDPVKDMAQALSPTYRQNVWDWYCSTFLTRGMGQDSILITLTRWHEDDLAGRLLEKMKNDPDSDQWEIICFPEIKEDNQNPDDPREIGEVLWPSRYDLTKVKQTRASAGQIVWNSLYQQKPSMGEGGILKKAWWKFWTTLPPRLDDKIITCDPTMSGGEDKDFCVYQCWGRKGPDKFLIDQMRGQWDYPTSRKKLREFLSLHGKGVSVIKVENKANGPALIAELKSEFPGIVPFNPQGSKEARALSHANSASAQLEAGNIFLPDPVVAPWVADFIQEAAEFPKGRNDDQVDCYVMAILHWLESGFDLFGASGTFDEDVPETLIDSIIDAEW